MTRVILLSVIAMAMLVIAPLVGASNSLTLESGGERANALDPRKDIFDDIFGNDRNSDRLEDLDEERDRRDEYDENDEDDNSYDEFDFRRDRRSERVQEIHRRGPSNPYGEGDPRGGGQYEWR